MSDIVSHQMRLWHFFIISITAATMYAAFWEFWGNKLATTPQEIRFVLGIRSLLTQLEKFKREIEGKPFSEKFTKFGKFCDFFLAVTSNTLCGKKEVAGGLMIYQKGKLALHSYTPGSMYQHGLEVPFGAHVRKDLKGPAARAFESGNIAYMPKKSNHIGIILEAGTGETYSLVEMFEGWYSSQSEAEENFRSVLSIPVNIFAEEGEKINYGVLNYTTEKRDLFVPRDYIMAECFASILAQALDATLSPTDSSEPAEPAPAPATDTTSPHPPTDKTKNRQSPNSNFPQQKRKKRRKGRR